MPVIHDQGSYRIIIWPREHGEPHVHVYAAKFSAKVAIKDGRLIVGTLPAPQRRRVLRWIAANRDMLARRWAEIAQV
ncbi:MAG: DUF4160 domain-containing protein [Proteobacteria bacterium]|nr:DUF4160 domain-containing protein [Pseudomonadota bacterium]